MYTVDDWLKETKVEMEVKTSGKDYKFVFKNNEKSRTIPLSKTYFGSEDPNIKEALNIIMCSMVMLEDPSPKQIALRSLHAVTEADHNLKMEQTTKAIDELKNIFGDDYDKLRQTNEYQELITKQDMFNYIIDSWIQENDINMVAELQIKENFYKITFTDSDQNDFTIDLGMEFFGKIEPDLNKVIRAMFLLIVRIENPSPKYLATKAIRLAVDEKFAKQVKEVSENLGEFKEFLGSSKYNKLLETREYKYLAANQDTILGKVNREEGL